MTGESLPVDKVTHNRILDPTTGRIAITEEHVTDGDRINLAFASTSISKGRGRGIVIATGMATAVGRIAAAAAAGANGHGSKKRKPGRSMSIRKYGPAKAAAGGARRLGDLVLRLVGLQGVTPLQRRLTYLAYALFLLAVVIALVVFGVHKFQLNSEVVLYATSTGIALIPESLAIVLIMTMVQATRVMRRSNVVVRDLAALELLGGVTHICSDKTGTLTQGAMVVKAAWLPALLPQVLFVQGNRDPNDPAAGEVVAKIEASVDEEENNAGQLARPHQTVQGGQAEQSDSAAHTGRAGQSVQFAIDDKPATQKPTTPALTPELRMFLLACALCNVASVHQDPSTGTWQAIGEPTEIALQVFAERFGMGKRALEIAGWTQVAEFPFDSNLKRMSVVYAEPDGADRNSNDNGKNKNRIVLSKGAVERILERCSFVSRGMVLSEGASSPVTTIHDIKDGTTQMTDVLREQILAQMNTFAPLGLRVLALAYRPWFDELDTGVPNDDGVGEKADAEKTPSKGPSRDGTEHSLTFLGLVGIYDPPRVETAQSIRECTHAGIDVHMLTGDHPATAEAIAREVGILPPGFVGAPVPQGDMVPLVLTATAFDAMSDAELDALADLPRVVARCTPETKTRMIEALRRRGRHDRARYKNGTRSAMTGDGVNDAPSLRRADVGIAMGGPGSSDVAKAAAAIVLTDDRFSSIVTAVREGRRMFDNIQKFMLHLLVSNIAEVILLVIGLAFRDNDGYSVFPLSALHILWINLFTSAAPALGLGMEAASPAVMRRKPAYYGGSIVSAQLLADMALYGAVMGTVSLLTFVTVVYGVYGGVLGHDCNRAWSESCRGVFRARAAVFVQLTYLILVSAWEFKDTRHSLFRLNPRNPHPFPANVATDLWANKLLFFSVIIGLIPPIILVYVPVIGETVLRHQPISWEWGLVVAGQVLFLSAVEAWKYMKRTLGLFDDTVHLGGEDEEDNDETAWRFHRRRSGYSSDGSEIRRLSRGWLKEKLPPRVSKTITMSTMQSSGADA